MLLLYTFPGALLGGYFKLNLPAASPSPSPTAFPRVSIYYIIIILYLCPIYRQAHRSCSCCQRSELIVFSCFFHRSARSGMRGRIILPLLYRNKELQRAKKWNLNLKKKKQFGVLSFNLRVSPSENFNFNNSNDNLTSHCLSKQKDCTIT